MYVSTNKGEGNETVCSLFLSLCLFLVVDVVVVDVIPKEKVCSIDRATVTEELKARELLEGAWTGKKRKRGRFIKK